MTGPLGISRRSCGNVCGCQTHNIHSEFGQIYSFLFDLSGVTPVQIWDKKKKIRCRIPLVVRFMGLAQSTCSTLAGHQEAASIVTTSTFAEPFLHTFFHEYLVAIRCKLAGLSEAGTVVDIVHPE